MRRAPLVPDQLDFVTSIHWDRAPRWNVSTLIAGYIDCGEVRNGPFVFDPSCIASWLGSDIVVLFNLPGRVAFSADLDALEVAMC